MPVGTTHDAKEPLYDLVREVVKKEVAHGIDKHHSGSSPSERYFEEVLVDGWLKTLCIARVSHCLKALCHPFGIAVLAARAELRAACQRVPG